MGLIVVAAGSYLARAAGDVSTSTAAHLLAPLILNDPVPGRLCLPFPPLPPDDAGIEGEVIARLNQQRAAHGLPDLVAASELTQAARRHSNDMADNHFTGHTGSDGSTAGQRVKEACYDWERVGEIIGWGFGNPGSMVNWWLNSPPHRALILSSALEDVGAAYVDERTSRYRTYWTVNFGRWAPARTAVGGTLHTCVYAAGDAFQGSILFWRSAAPCPALPPQD